MEFAAVAEEQKSAAGWRPQKTPASQSKFQRQGTISSVLWATSKTEQRHRRGAG